ncbi:MmgE/PrpD [Altererythrobacter marinus]|uniref:MmgE/PrpD n=1 Tax=Pelagerythrobacter marinus TaxID=538382 RepID=A0ABW9UXB4_9SPHN|nr:MmgE/PrpD [Pelagerythrobacter marinus]
MSATQRLLDFARADHRLGPSTRAAAEHLLGDTLAVGAAGRSFSETTGLADATRRWGAGPEARAIGSGERLPAPSAAFLNGFRIHCLEWDAVHSQAVVHALSVVTAALGAAIDRRGGCDPEAALAALAVGVDVASGIGVASTGAMRFFRPATAGVLGAALAVARIEGVDRLEDVLGLAYSQAAGTMQAHLEGSIALPIQIAVAVRAAITAVDLAAAGLTGPHDPLEGPFGFYGIVEDGELARYTDTIGETWRIEEVAIKPFPSGRASHAVLGTLDTLLRAGEITPATVTRIEAFVPPLIHRLVARPASDDMTASYARLSLPFLTALMLADGRIDPRRFTPATFADPAIRALAAKFAITLDGNEDPNALDPQRVVITLSDGRMIERRVDHTLGSVEAPMSDEQTAAKRGLARELAGPEADPRIFDNPLSYFTEPR